MTKLTVHLTPALMALQQIDRMLADRLPSDPAVNPFADAELPARELQIRWDAQNESVHKIVREALAVKYSLHQANAIVEMAAGRHDYNLGVLSMLGLEELGAEHKQLSSLISELVAERDQLDERDTTADANTYFTTPLNSKAAAKQTEIDALSAEQRAVWAKIQAIIDEARSIVESADHLGMRLSP